jgi:hypothetical protein
MATTSSTTANASSSSSNVAAAAEQQQPYVALGLSPCRLYAVAARKDTIVVLDISPSGQRTMTVRRSIGGISTFLETAATTASSSKSHSSHHHHYIEPAATLNLRTFGYGGGRGGGGVVAPPVAAAAGSGNSAAVAHITEVSWGNDNLIAVAGSNGAILVWSKQILLLNSQQQQQPEKTSVRGVKSGGNGKGVMVNNNRLSPEAVFPQLHIRAINRLSWHPTMPNVLLSASSDGTVILWEPVDSSGTAATTTTSTTTTAATDDQQHLSNKSPGRFSFGFGGGGNNNAGSSAKRQQQEQQQQQPLLRWQSRGIFKPKGDGVKDVRWSPHHRDGTPSIGCCLCILPASLT